MTDERTEIPIVLDDETAATVALYSSSIAAKAVETLMGIETEQGDKDANPFTVVMVGKPNPGVLPSVVVEYNLFNWSVIALVRSKQDAQAYIDCYQESHKPDYHDTSRYRYLTFAGGKYTGGTQYRSAWETHQLVDQSKAAC